MAETFAGLVDNVAGAAHELGMDLSPHDVGALVSMFLEGVIHNTEGPPLHPAVEKFLQTMADEAASVENE